VRDAGRIACCAFGRLELAATIHRNLREGKITPSQSRIIFAQIDLDESNHIWSWLPVSPDLLAQTTSRFRSIKPTTYLRAADALHLACASVHGFAEIFSNDRHLLKASAAFKIKGRNVIV
jgi:predicted nucleic acid-binding protein